MIDQKLLRTELDTVATKLAKRGYKLDKTFWLGIEEQRKVLQVKTEDLQAKKNAGAKKVGELKRKGENTDALMHDMQTISEQMKQAEEALRTLQETITQALLALPNLPDDSVPVGLNENDNVEIRRWGTPCTFDFAIKDHSDLGENLGLLDFELASKLTGSRFSVLKGSLAKLNRALVAYMLNVHTQRGYTEMYMPYMVNSDSLLGTGQLPKFEEDLFKLRGDKAYYLIPTSEVPLTNTVRNVILADTDLPIKLTSHTPCFRSEAGSAGRDTRGLIRQHQFEKVEMVQIVHPDKSMEALEEMTAQAEFILQSLGLPYRTIVLCGGDMGFGAMKTYDIEVWLPSQNTYREISSVSNCGDFQARRMQARFKSKDSKKSELVHTLNGSGLAIGRTLLAIMENYQNADGTIGIPEVLRPFMGCDVIG
ncbi:seryl-tRNA ligase [Moraxella macacae 0408225]|uniref:Serine--tRNA ligase n=1 Tax=Moraxella macacae 0408225 TaxID=1230338 RepID=L2F563_9GAMM|nr:serine--tRNA ligase [Moraxella macacae]ELA08040.1 seryl-tRNA ligase [Moraxella macacae 0408225]